MRVPRPSFARAGWIQALSPQKLLQPLRLVIGSIHEFVGGIQVLLRQCLARLVKLVMQPVHPGKDVAADIEPLLSLLTADLVDTRECGIRPRFKVGEALMSFVHLAGSRP